MTLKLISYMTLNIVHPKNILSTLKREIPKSITAIRQVYNVCTQNNKATRYPRSEMQQLLNLFDEDHHVSRYIVCKNRKTIRDIFWNHHDSIKLFNTLPFVLIIDSTYKANKYMLPLMEIIGITFTNDFFIRVFIFEK